MTGESKGKWRFEKKLSVSTVVQLVLLASLIIGSWVNLQRQLALLQRDVGELMQSCKGFEAKLEQLCETSISHEYRIQAMEQSTKINKGDERVATP